MAKGIENDIDALVKDGILTNPTADAISDWYAVKNATNPNRLILVFSVIAVLAICRFFDTDLSFILRGLMFILVGAGFVYFNYQLIQKKKTA
jgi:hypothetical protein